MCGQSIVVIRVGFGKAHDGLSLLRLFVSHRFYYVCRWDQQGVSMLPKVSRCFILADGLDLRSDPAKHVPDLAVSRFSNCAVVKLSLLPSSSKPINLEFQITFSEIRNNGPTLKPKSSPILRDAIDKAHDTRQNLDLHPFDQEWRALDINLDEFRSEMLLGKDLRAKFAPVSPRSRETGSSGAILTSICLSMMRQRRNSLWKK